MFSFFNNIFKRKHHAAQSIKAEQQSLKKAKKDIGKGSGAKASRNSVVHVKAKGTTKTIPYRKMHKFNIMELFNKTFSKTYSFPDINFTSAVDEEQIGIFTEYAKLLNSISNEVKLQLTIINCVCQ